MRRFQKAKEILQSDQFGNVLDFFQSSGVIAGTGTQSQVPIQQQQQPVQQKTDYTPLYILGAIAVLVAIIKR